MKPTAFNRSNFLSKSFPCSIFLSLLAAMPAAQAANGEWTGGTSATWATTTNWVGGTVAGGTSANADIATFNSATYSFQPTAVGNYFLGGLSFGGSNGGTSIITGTGNNRLNIGSGGISMASGTGAVTLGNVSTGQGINITANQNWTNDSSSLLNISRVSVDDALTGTYTITINGSGSGGVAVNSNLSDDNNLASATRKAAVVINTSGSGATNFTNGSTYSGGTTLTAGLLQIGGASAGTVGAVTSSAIGTGSLALNGGKISSGSTAARTILNALSIGGDVAIGDATNTGALTFSANADLGAATRSLTLASNATFDGVVSNGGITKLGAGTMSLTGASANTYSGLTTVSAGGLTLSKTGVNAIAGDALVNGTGTLTLGAADQISNSSNVEVAAGTFALGTNSDTVNNVKLTGGVITGSSGVLTSSTAYDFQSSGNVTGILAGSAGANKTTAGTVTFTGGNANTYTGLTTVSAGSLVLGRTTGVDALAGDALVSGGTLQITNSNQIKDSANLEVASGTFAMGGNSDTVNNLKLTGGAITGSGTLTSTTAFDFQSSGNIAAVLAGTAGANKTTAGTVTFTGANANTYTGLTTVGAGSLVLGKTAGVVALAGNALVNGTGTLQIVNANQINDTANLEVATGGTFAMGGNAETVNGVKLTGGSITGNATTGILTSGTAFDLQSGSSGAILAGSVDANKTTGGTVILTGANTYSGATTISAGTLQIGNGGTAGSIAGTSGVTNDAALVYRRSDALTAAYAISGTGTLDKQGAGTLTLTNTNSYTGATTVSAGTLVVNGNISTSSLTTVQTGATLGGSGTVGDLTIDAGGFFSPGNSPGIMTTGDYIQNGQLNIEVDGLAAGNGAGFHDQVVVNGTVSLGGLLSIASFGGFTPVSGDLLFILLNDNADAVSGTFTGLAQGAVVGNFGGLDWQISYLADSSGNTFTGGNDIALMAIPEPNVAALLGGVGAILLLRRRRA